MDNNEQGAFEVPPFYYLDILRWESARAMAIAEDRRVFGVITNEERERYRVLDEEQKRRDKVWYRRLWRTIMQKYEWLKNLRIHDQRFCEQDEE